MESFQNAQDQLIKLAINDLQLAKQVLAHREKFDADYQYLLTALAEAAAAGYLLTRNNWKVWVEKNHPECSNPSQVASQLAIFNRIFMKYVKPDDMLGLLAQLDDAAKARQLRAAVGQLKAGEYDEGIRAVEAAGGDATQVKQMLYAQRLQEMSFGMTDVGNAEMFAAVYRQDMRYVSEWRRWLIWDGKRWAVDNRQTATVKAMELVRYVMPEYAKTIKDDDARAKYHRHIASSQNKGRIDNMVDLAGANLAVATGELDRDPDLFNCQNGTLNTKTGVLMPHNRQDLLTKISPCRYDTDATCPRWNEFLTRIFEKHLDLMPFLQQAVGYSLTGSVEEQCLFILYGSGANGKSTFLNALLYCLGDYGQQAQPSLLLNSGNKVGNGEDVARLFGIRFVSSIETKDGKSFDDARVKSLTGGDRISARRLYENSWEFNPTHKIFLATNHLPRIDGADDAMGRRLKLIPFDAVIRDDEKDAKLGEKLKAEADGIFRWAVEGLTQWRAGGLRAPSIVRDKVAEYRAESDTFGQFLSDVCIIDDGAFVKSSQLFACYEGWAKDMGIDFTINALTLSKKLKERGYKSTRKGDGIYWTGLGLAAVAKADADLQLVEERAF